MGGCVLKLLLFEFFGWEGWRGGVAGKGKEKGEGKRWGGW